MTDTTTKTITTTRLLCSRSTTLSARRLLRCKFRLLFFRNFFSPAKVSAVVKLAKKKRTTTNKNSPSLNVKYAQGRVLPPCVAAPGGKKKGTDASSGHDSSFLTHLFMSQHWPLGRDHLSRRGGTSFQRRIVAQIAFTCG